MEKRTYTYAQLGMLFGIFAGTGLGVVMFAATGEVLFIILSGAGAAVGLVIGAGFDSFYREKSEKQN